MAAICLSCGCRLPGDDHGDSRNITAAGLTAAAQAAGISLREAAANVVNTLPVLRQQETPDGGMLVAKAAAAEQRYVLGIAYQAGPDPRIAKGVDGGRDYFTEAELEKAAWSFLRNGPRVGAFHLDGTDGAGGMATVVESYIYRGPNWDLGDGIVAKSGDWLVGAILSERAWDLYKQGRIAGLSPQGTAKRRRSVPAPA